jgi:hypothetical protein
MSNILYYSNYCNNCKKLLEILQKTKTRESIHFLCIDQRQQNSDGSLSILLKNGSKILLPPTIVKVPALLLPNNGFQVLFGDQIYQHLQPKEKMMMNQATKFQGEPDAFGFDSLGSYGVSSDAFSFLDMNSDDLSAKGNGGLRQMYNYVNINDDGVTIETPPDTYEPDKIKDGELEKYEKKRQI